MKKLTRVLTIAVLSLGLIACGNSKVSVELQEVGDTPMKLIKEVQEITGLELKDAKAIVDKVPSIVVEDVTEEEAKEIIEKLEAVSGKAVIK